jgi:hypothetical protein
MKMNKYPLMIVAGIVAAAVPWACGGSSGTTGAGAAPAGTGGTSPASSTHASSSKASTGPTTGTGGSGGAGGGNACSGELDPGGCNDCLSAQCCDQLTACFNDTDCSDCAGGTETDPSECTSAATMALLNAITTCQKASCNTDCTAAPPPCNPVTNAGCPANSACDLGEDANGNSDYQCFDTPAPTQAICATCDDQNTACIPGATCFGSGICAKYCCNDGDCGTGTCDMSSTIFGEGICVDGADSGTETAACDAPTTSPSNGTCVMGFVGDGG